LAFVVFPIRFISAPSGGGLRGFSRAVRATIHGSADVCTGPSTTPFDFAQDKLRIGSAGGDIDGGVDLSYNGGGPGRVPTFPYNGVRVRIVPIGCQHSLARLESPKGMEYLREEHRL
jgi:hypothetical protein